MALYGFITLNSLFIFALHFLEAMATAKRASLQSLRKNVVAVLSFDDFFHLAGKNLTQHFLLLLFVISHNFAGKNSK